MRRAQRRMYHFIYKTICIVTKKYYIGMHSTDNLDDEYLGSGKRLWYSIKKYGKENHKKEILEFLSSREKLKEREREIVNEKLLVDIICMNIMIGGEGGKISDEQQRNRSILGGKAFAKKLKEDKEFAKRNSEIVSKEMKRKHKLGLIKYNTFEGKHHTKETKEKMKLSHKNRPVGKNNPQYGMKWITNGIENKKIKNINELPNGWKFGRTLK